MTVHPPFEILIIGLLWLSAFLLARVRPRRVSSLLRGARWLGRRPLVAVAASGGLSMALTLLIASAYLPVPLCHDEFGYLLAADTYSHGRLTNPTHPFWPHFESFHIFHQPTYMSKYPPAQGMFLALGQVVVGHPVAGVWLSVSLAAAAFCWMLFGWLPGRWAALGGLMIAVYPALILNWGQCYYGGAVAMCAACLVYGALPRLLRRPRIGTWILMAIGLVILANSRPFEGFVASLPVAGFLLVRFLRSDATYRLAALSRFVLPVATILVAAGAAMGYYNHKVTGSVLKMPYQLHEESYSVTPLFLWGTPRPEPEYRHQLLRQFYAHDSQEQFWWPQRTLVGWAKRKLGDGLFLWVTFLGVLLSIPLMTVCSLLRRRRLWFPAAILVLTGLCSLSATWLIPHYFAPVLPLLLLLVMEGLRHLYAGPGWQRACRSRFATGLVALYALFSAWQIVGYAALAHQRPPAAFPAQKWAWERERVRQRLLGLPGKHLAIVHYAPRHAASPAEWVYNDAEIDSSRIVWAREWKPLSDRNLVNYFRDRRVWLVLADTVPPQLIEIDAETGRALSAPATAAKPESGLAAIPEQ